MNSFNYFVSYNYDFRNVKKTLKILQTLDVTGHKLLYGVNYVGNTGISDNTVREIKEIYDQYVSDKSVFGDNKNISGIPELIGRVIKKDMQTDVEFASEKEQWAYISALDEEKAFKYKYLVALMLKIFAGKFGYRRREILTYDKIRFCGEKDISFSTSYGICGTPDERNLFIWFEIDAENDLFLLDNSRLELIITDDTEKFNNYLYSVSIVEYNNFNLVIGGNDLNKLMDSYMPDICSEDNRFVKYTPEIKRYM